MKKFTMIFLPLLLLCFTGMVVYVGLCEDFEKPLKEQLDMDAPVWSKSFDELIEYLMDRGLISNPKRFEWSAGEATIAYTIDGVTYFWWDVENMDPESNEYRVYRELVQEGKCDVWGDGLLSSPELNGPFGMEIGGYSGDASALIEAFYEFGKEE